MDTLADEDAPLGECCTLVIQGCRLRQSLRHNVRPPGTNYCWVGKGSMKWEVCLTLLYMTSSGNRTSDYLILSKPLFSRPQRLPTVYSAYFCGIALLPVPAPCANPCLVYLYHLLLCLLYYSKSHIAMYTTLIRSRVKPTESDVDVGI